MLNEATAASFRQAVRARFVPLVRETMPSLADTEKPAPADDWSRQTVADS